MKKYIINSEKLNNCKKLSSHLNDLKKETQIEIQDRMVLCRFEDSESIDIDEFFSAPPPENLDLTQGRNSLYHAGY